jgi:hypothetical protein
MSYANEIKDYIYKNYNTVMCEKKETAHNYYQINSIVKCDTDCMRVSFTLYIYFCNYEALLVKIANTKSYLTYNVIEADNNGFYLQVSDSVSIHIGNSENYGLVESVDIDIEVTSDT